MKKLIRKWLFQAEFDALNAQISDLKHDSENKAKYVEIGKKAEQLMKDHGCMMIYTKPEERRNKWCALFGDYRTKHERYEDAKQSAIKSGIRHSTGGKIYTPANLASPKEQA